MVKEGVSKARARKTRSREKRAGKPGAPPRPLLRSPVTGAFIVFLLWLLAMFGLRAHELARNWHDAALLLPMISDAVFALAALCAGGVFLEHVRPEFVRRNSRLALMSLSALASLALASVLQHTAQMLGWIEPGLVKFLLPYAFAPLLLTIMLGTRAAMVTGLWTALAMSLLMERSIPVLVQGVVATAVAMHFVRRVRKRSRVVKAGALVGLAHVVCVLGTTALDWTTVAGLATLAQQAGAGIVAGMVSGVVCAILVLLVLPFLEHLFAITTDISLLELSDLGHPLLQRLALEAPGTYHHSLVVANLCQAAADAIGANSLEARVGAYFHDIGKLTKPDFFAENIHMRSNPHDELPPSMSALIISAHVKEGVSLALHYRLPKPVLAAIREHHGSSMISYFHQKAKAQMVEENGGKGSRAGGATRVEESGFRYQGPRPMSRVSGILCLADATEAASRSLDKPGPAHLDGLLNSIFRARIEDGQLDDCELRMSDLKKIKRAFAFTLSTMFHGRMPYPKDEPDDKQPAAPASDEPARDRPAGEVADGADATEPPA